ncbi:hypothetical protein [Nostoc sp. C057]|nr:hypothetical protein [Nostoc sp. C057]
MIIIKKLLVKFPQWGIACVDGGAAELGGVVNLYNREEFGLAV